MALSTATALPSGGEEVLTPLWPRGQRASRLLLHHQAQPHLTLESPPPLQHQVCILWVSGLNVCPESRQGQATAAGSSLGRCLVPPVKSLGPFLPKAGQQGAANPSLGHTVTSLSWVPRGAGRCQAITQARVTMTRVVTSSLELWSCTLSR